jgi:hypothetical protein
VGSTLLVGLGLSVVLVLGDLVGDGITGSVETSADALVGVLGNVLVGLLGSSGGSA